MNTSTPLNPFLCLRFFAILAIPSTLTVGMGLACAPKLSSLQTSESKYDVALRLEQGRNGKPKDYAAAAKLYREAADAKDARAMARLGDFYFRGLGVTKSSLIAKEWYVKATALKHSGAMLSLGNLYIQGEGVPKDIGTAIDWYRKAAEAKNSEAMSYLGKLYYLGFGVKKDYNLAADWYRKAATAGSASGMRSLGNLYNAGLGVERSSSQAAAWYERAQSTEEKEASILAKASGKCSIDFLDLLRKKASEVRQKLGSVPRDQDVSAQAWVVDFNVLGPIKITFYSDPTVEDAKVYSIRVSTNHRFKPEDIAMLLGFDFGGFSYHHYGIEVHSYVRSSWYLKNAGGKGSYKLYIGEKENGEGFDLELTLEN